MLTQVIEIVREASALMIRGGFEVMQKDGIENLVTSSDLAVQHFLMEKLSALLPESGFFCEEEDAQSFDKEKVWIIDPIDGTANYSRGISDCCISVALAVKGELEMGVVYSPWREELYCAERGKGAFFNGERISVSKRPFEDGLFCTAMSTYRKEFARSCSDIIYDIYMQSNDTRRFGSAALELCMLARGIIELYFELRLQPWDYAAGTLILREAGGAIAGFDGSEPSLQQASLVVASNSGAHTKRLLEIVHQHLDKLPY